MTDTRVPATTPSDQPAAAPAAPRTGPTAELNSAEKAAIIIGVLGPGTAGPLLESFDDSLLRIFTKAMARLRRIGPGDVRRTIAEFLQTLDAHRNSVRGGVDAVREILEPVVGETELARILDDADTPSVSNVWEKLARVSEESLAEFLAREHEQTAAVILSKLAPDHAARVLALLPGEKASEVVGGITRAIALDTSVVEAIGGSVSRDFLIGQHRNAPRSNPADRVGAIMNFTPAEMREEILSRLGDAQPAFADEVRRKMFTFEDIPARLPPRGVSLMVAAVDRDALLKALAGAQGKSAAARDFLLSNLASRVGAQIQEGLEELGDVSRRDAESAQTEVVRGIRDLVNKGEITLISADDDA